LPQIRKVDSSAKHRLKKQTKGFQEREPYRQAIQSLSGDRMIEIEPDAGETVRKIRLNLARAAKEVNIAIGYGETDENTVLAWLEQGNGRRRRGRRARAEVTA
jgi:hypothetical protein